MVGDERLDCSARMHYAGDNGANPGDGSLFVRCEGSLPPRLGAHSADAIFCVGSCFHPESSIRRLSIQSPAGLTEVKFKALPRIGLFRELHSQRPSRDPGDRSYRSGFWSIVPVGPMDPGTLEVAVVAELENGLTVSAPFAEIPIEPLPRVHMETPERATRIGICMATYDPDPNLFRVQVESIRSQTSNEWVCYVSDDHSTQSSWGEIRDIIGDDPRFVLSRAERRLGFYRNFERALAMVPDGCEFIALCDQDDRWYPEKLDTLAASIGENQLVYSDQRLTLRDGSVIRDTLWVGRSRNDDNLYSITIANTVVGASSLMRRDLLERILPFPQSPGWQFHDHWISAVAMATGSVRYVDRPLYDYVQHETAIVGRVSVERSDEGQEPGMLSALRHPRRTLLRWKSIYFRSYVHVALQAQILLERCSDRMSARDSRALRRLATADHSLLGSLELAVRPVRELWGRNETLGTEWHILRGIVWLWLVRLREAGMRSPTGARQDVAVPEFDLVSQRRLKRWFQGRSQAAVRTSSSV